MRMRGVEDGRRTMRKDEEGGRRKAGGCGLCIMEEDGRRGKEEGDG